MYTTMSYKQFATFYDEAMGNRSDVGMFIEKLIRQHHPTAKTVLEIACGTGSLLSYLVNRGYFVAGLDLSPEMLAVARKKLPPAVELTLQDMTSFVVARHYDVVLCAYDSINHLTQYHQWEQVFVQASTHLEPRGLFIFDMNTQLALERLAQADPISRSLANASLKISVSKQGELYDWRIDVTENIGGSNTVTHTEVIEEQSFSVERVKYSLTKLFHEVIMLDQCGGEVREDSQRVYFVCSK